MFILPSKQQVYLYTALIATSMSPLFLSVAQAGNMYIYKDNSGQVLLTNVNPEGNFNKFTQKVKVTYYPDSGSQFNTSNSSADSRNSYPASYRGYNKPSPSANRNAYDGYIQASATRHGVDPALVKAMMHTESAFNPNARSPVGAQGLMQLMPATARRFKVRNAWNPSENIEGAAKYIAWLTKRFKGNMEHVVAGYNAGEGNVSKYGGIPPFKETQGYVKKVLGRYNTLYKHDNRLSHATRHSYSRANNQRVSYSSTTPTYGTSRNYSQSAYAALR